MKNYHRKFDITNNISPTKVEINGLEYLFFGSTSYLATHWNEQFSKDLDYFIHNLEAKDFASIGSHYLGGYSQEKYSFEQELKKYLETEECLSFNNGWSACFSVAEWASEWADIIISDPKNHNSIIKGISKKKVKVIVEDCNYPKLIKKVIENNRDKKIAIFYPSICGITGEIRNLSLASSNNIIRINDITHSFGSFEIETEADIYISSLSKGFGSQGGVIFGKSQYILEIKQKASPWIFSTPLSPITWKYNKLILKHFTNMQDARKHILFLANKFRKLLSDHDIKHIGNSHITGLQLGGLINNVEDFYTFIKSQGILIKVSAYPTMPIGKETSRITFNPFHTIEDVKKLVEVIFNWKQNFLS